MLRGGYLQGSARQAGQQGRRFAGQATPALALAIGQRLRTRQAGTGQAILQGEVEIERRRFDALEQGQHEATGSGRHEIIEFCMPAAIPA
jgi:hypothetical protein